MAGFQPINTISAAPWNGAARSYPISLTLTNAYPLNQGDPVVQVADGGISPATTALTGTMILGVFVSCQYKLTGQLAVQNATYFPGPGASYDMSVPPTAQIIDDPNVIYSLQTNGNTGLLATDVGQNCLYAFPSTPATNGQSGVLLDLSNKAVTATYYLKIIGLAPDNITITPSNGNPYTGPNAFGVPGNHALVKINTHLYGSSGTVGI